MATRKKTTSKKRSSKKQSDVKKVTTPKFRVSFANVFHAREVEYEDGTKGDAKYSLVMIFDEDADLRKMERLVEQTIKENAAMFNNKLKSVRRPFRDAEEKDDLEGFEEGKIFASASSQYRPGIVDKDLTMITDQEDFYSGCYARATVTCYPYNKKGNKGVAFGLQNLQKLADGEQLSGRTSADEDFDEVDDDDMEEEEDWE